MPNTRYRGATLDVTSLAGERVKKAWTSGVYRIDASGVTLETSDVRHLSRLDQVGVISFARAGQTCPPEGTLAELVSHAPLYDARGALSARGRHVSSAFRYT